jgi:hypothetical protein
MKKLLTFILCIYSLACFSQDASKKETFDWLLTKLQICDVYVKVPGVAISISYNESDCTLTFTSDNKSEEIIYLSNLNPSSISWEAPTGTNPTMFPNELNLILSSANDVNAANICDINGKNSKPLTRTELHFNLSKLNNPKDPNLRDRIAKALSQLILLCGGKEVQEKY